MKKYSLVFLSSNSYSSILVLIIYYISLLVYRRFDKAIKVLTKIKSYINGIKTDFIGFKEEFY